MRNKPTEEKPTFNVGDIIELKRSISSSGCTILAGTKVKIINVSFLKKYYDIETCDSQKRWITDVSIDELI